MDSSSENKWICYKCDRIFSSKDHFDRHIVDQTCQQFAENLSNKELVSTLSYIPQENPLKCGQCNRIYAYKQSLDRHKAICQSLRDKKKAIASRKEIFKCDPCNKVYKRKHCLTNHQRKPSCLLYQPPTDQYGQLIPSNPKFICGDFGAQYSVKSNLQKHKDEGFCQQRQIKLKQTLNSLKKTTQNKRFHQCKTCSKVYKRKSVLLRHQEEHVLSLPNLLPAGDGELHLRSLVEDALALNKKELKLQFPCRWCYASFSSQAAMVTHMNQVHEKYIPNEKLSLPDKETSRIDFNRPKTNCCYICLKKFHCVYTSYICLEFCEERIGVSLDGYQHPNRR